MRCLAKVGQICGCGRVKLPAWYKEEFRLIGTKHRTFSMHLCVEHVRPTSRSLPYHFFRFLLIYQLTFKLEIHPVLVFKALI